MSGEKKKTKDKIFEMTNESAQHRHEGNSKTHQGLKEISEIDKKKKNGKEERTKANAEWVKRKNTRKQCSQRSQQQRP